MHLPTLPSLIALSVPIVVLLAMLVFVRSTGAQLPEENGRAALYTERCSASSGRFLRFGTNLPTCRITLYDDGLVAAIGAPIFVKYQDVEGALCTQSWLLKSVRLHIRATPDLILTFSSRAPAKIGAILKQKGVRVTGLQG